jgi:hypothetical protein
LASPRNTINFNSAMEAPWKIQDKNFSAQLHAFEARLMEN